MRTHWSSGGHPHACDSFTHQIIGNDDSPTNQQQRGAGTLRERISSGHGSFLPRELLFFNKCSWSELGSGKADAIRFKHVDEGDLEAGPFIEFDGNPASDLLRDLLRSVREREGEVDSFLGDLDFITSSIRSLTMLNWAVGRREDEKTCNTCFAS